MCGIFVFLCFHAPCQHTHFTETGYLNVKPAPDWKMIMSKHVLNALNAVQSDSSAVFHLLTGFSSMFCGFCPLGTFGFRAVISELSEGRPCVCPRPTLDQSRPVQGGRNYTRTGQEGRKIRQKRDEEENSRRRQTMKRRCPEPMKADPSMSSFLFVLIHCHMSETSDQSGTAYASFSLSTSLHSPRGEVLKSSKTQRLHLFSSVTKRKQLEPTNV